MNNNLLLGAKYFRYDENDNIELVRVTRHNDVEVKLIVDGTNNHIKMPIEELEKKYIRLNPHAIVNFCIVKLKDGLDDVVVTMHKMSDLSSNEPTPYCVCRQNITDIFANQIQITPNKMYVGCCMSIETCPPDIDYRIMIACNGMQKCVNVCTYMDDTLNDILGFVKAKDFDNTLVSLYTDHVKSVIKNQPTLSMMKDRIMKLDSYDGYCKTLRLLLEQNNFMYDYYQAFRIIPIDKEVIYDNEGAVSNDIAEIISDLYEVNIRSTLCMDYWYDIDLNNIQNDYVLIMDKNNKLFVVAYVSDGPKHINIEKVESAENIERLANSTLGNNKSIKEAANHIRLNKNKYN